MDYNKRPHRILLDKTLKIIEEDKDNRKFLFQHSDNLIMWLVGFSIAGLGLMVSNKAFIPNETSILFTKGILLGLFLTILFGVSFRVTYYFRFLKENIILEHICDRLSESDLYSVVNIDPSNSVEELAYYFKATLNKEINIDDFYTHDLQKQKEKINLFKTQYKKFSEIVNSDKNKAVEDIRKIFKEEYDWSEKTLNKKLGNKKNLNARDFKIYKTLNDVFFIACTITFIITILILCFIKIVEY